MWAARCSFTLPSQPIIYSNSTLSWIHNRYHWIDLWAHGNLMRICKWKIRGCVQISLCTETLVIIIRSHSRECTSLKKRTREKNRRISAVSRKMCTHGMYLTDYSSPPAQHRAEQQFSLNMLAQMETFATLVSVRIFASHDLPFHGHRFVSIDTAVPSRLPHYYDIITVALSPFCDVFISRHLKYVWFACSWSSARISNGNERSQGTKWKSEETKFQKQSKKPMTHAALDEDITRSSQFARLCWAHSNSMNFPNRCVWKTKENYYHYLKHHFKKLLKYKMLLNCSVVILLFFPCGLCSVAVHRVALGCHSVTLRRQNACVWMWTSMQIYWDFTTRGHKTIYNFLMGLWKNSINLLIPVHWSHFARSLTQCCFSSFIASSPSRYFSPQVSLCK